VVEILSRLLRSEGVVAGGSKARRRVRLLIGLSRFNPLRRARRSGRTPAIERVHPDAPRENMLPDEAQTG